MDALKTYAMALPEKARHPNIAPYLEFANILKSKGYTFREIVAKIAEKENVIIKAGTLASAYRDRYYVKRRARRKK